MRYRKLPVEIEATQWFKRGDHPQDGGECFESGEFKGLLLEGKIVRDFCHPTVPGTNGCRYCDKKMNDHGWIDTREGGHIVCPGDFVITGVKGEHYPCKPDIFALSYEVIDGPQSSKDGSAPDRSNSADEKTGVHTDWRPGD